MAAIAEKIIGMDGNPFEPEVIEGTVKLRADGKAKRTHPNPKTGGTTWVDPIRKEEDIEKIIKYLQAKVDNEQRVDYRKAFARNKLYFCIGISSGFRVSDLVGAREGTEYKYKDENGNIYTRYPEWTGLKWQDVYCKDGKTFRKEIAVKELKTGKMRKVENNLIMQKYFSEYVEQFNPDTDSDNYIFVNRKKERLSSKTVDNFIKEATSACNLKGNYSTHSLRKTFVYQCYMGMVEDGEKLALAITQKMTGHRNGSDLLRYLGIQDEDVKKANESFVGRMSKIL